MKIKTFGTFIVSVLLINAFIIFSGSRRIASSEMLAVSATVHTVKYMADLEKTEITWMGKKPTGEHNGTIKLKSGYVLNDHGNINNGKFIIDMTSIVNTDLEKAEMKAKLEGHLHSADFFNTSEFPEAILEITKIRPLEGVEGMTNQVTANLTIKGKTHTIDIPSSITWEDNSMFVYSEFTFDRSKWDVKYGSRSFFDSLGDKFIYDDIEITIRTQLNTSH